MTDVVFRIGEEKPKVGDETPKTRCLRCGPAALSTAELLAILLQGSKGRDPMEHAREVLQSTGSLRALAGLSPNEVVRLGGLGASKASRILAALELSRRFADESVVMAETLGGAEEAYKWLKVRLQNLPHEVFAVVWMTQKHAVISYQELFRGSIHGSAIHPREVVKEALKVNAAACILVHPHPSGSCSPSPDDLRLTEELKSVLSRIDVRVVDHLILGGNGYFSFAREGLLN